MSGAADRLAALLADSPLPWLTLTVLAYLGAVWLYQRSGDSPYLIPVLPAVVAVVVVLLLTDTPYPVYFEHVNALYFLIGPTTVALAVPLYGQLDRIRQMWRPLGVALLVGSSAAIVSAVLVAWALGGSLETILSLAPKWAGWPRWRRRRWPSPAFLALWWRARFWMRWASRTRRCAVLRSA